MPAPLDGLLVLDFSTLLPGPLATLLLAEAGAEVIKIERPDQGEELRHYEPKWGRDSVTFALLNRGKKSLALDLKDPADRAKLEPLLARADVLVEQFRPGVMARLGLDYDSLSAINPGLVYCAITGYGQTGPKRRRAGHDLNYIGDAGLLSLASGPADRPGVPPGLIADIAGGAYPAVMNILLALKARDGSGKGCHLDIAMTENVLPFTFWALGRGQAHGRWPADGAEQLTGGSPRYRLYPTADGRLAAVAALEQKFWDGFCAAIELESEWREDRRDPAGTAARVAEIIAARPASHWARVFEQADCCCSIVQTLEEACADPQTDARGILNESLVNEQGDKIPALPVPIDPALRARRGTPQCAPPLGRDNVEVLSQDRS